MKFNTPLSVLGIMVFLLSFSSCMTSKEYAVTRKYGVDRNSVQNQAMVAEYEVDLKKKIEGSAVVKNGTVENAKNLALWDAITSNGADAIADPIYKVDQSPTEITVEAKGYLAKFKDIRIATQQDLIDYISLLISMNGIQSISFNMFKVYYQQKEIQSEIPEDKRLTNDEIEELWKDLNLNESGQGGSLSMASSTGGDVEVRSGTTLEYSGKTGRQIWKQDVKTRPLNQRVDYVNSLHPKDKKSYGKFVLGRTILTTILVTIPLALILSVMA